MQIFLALIDLDEIKMSHYSGYTYQYGLEGEEAGVSTQPSYTPSAANRIVLVQIGGLVPVVTGFSLFVSG